MVCRHDKNDPTCSSHPDYVDYSNAARSNGTTGYGYLASKLPKTPDAENYQILEAQEVGRCLVIRAKYPNCNACAYEGTKVMVFVNVKALNALKWKRIDPHFRSVLKGSDFDAPSPIARFPGSTEGWKMALDFARSIG